MSSATVRIMVFLVAGAGFAAPATAQRTDGRPSELEGIEITDRSGSLVPPELEFVDEQKHRVILADYFGRGKPLVVQLVYLECPMLCNLVVNGFVEAARELDWKPGEDYDVITVSFDPKDTPALARVKQLGYVEALGVEGAEQGWHFLTGEPDQTAMLAETLGFPFRYMEDTGDFAHGAGMFVLTPEGKISRTLYGIAFPPQTLRFSLMEASEGRLGTPLDKVVLFCFRYDPERHRYTLAAVNIMKLGGGITVLIVATWMAVLWRRDRRAAPRAA